MAAPRKDTPKRDDELAWDKESGEGSTVLEDDASNDHIGERVRVAGRNYSRMVSITSPSSP